MFRFIAERYSIPLCDYTTICLSIHFGWTFGFLVLAIRNKATMNMGVLNHSLLLLLIHVFSS